MAESKPGRRKPRIRKSAPTIRERVEASQAEPRPKRRQALHKAASPLRRLRLAQRRPVKALATVTRPVGKGLAWLTPRYLVNSARELRLVEWPGRKETWRLTLAVLIFAIVFGALVAGVDKGLDEVFKKVILK